MSTHSDQVPSTRSPGTSAAAREPPGTVASSVASTVLTAAVSGCLANSVVVVGVVCPMPGVAGELAFSLIDQVSVALSGIAGGSAEAGGARTVSPTHTAAKAIPMLIQCDI